MKSQPQYVYLCDHTHCIDDIKQTLFMTWDLLYLWKNMHPLRPVTHDLWHSTLYPIHQSIIPHIKLNISDNTSTVLQSSHTDCWSYKPHCMYDNTGTICMTSCEYIWHHINSLWYHIMLWHSHTLYSRHHTQDTCHGIHWIWAITYSLLIIACLKCVWYQTTICMTSYEI